jgi:putative solute:sodium symporter small subunit
MSEEEKNSPGDAATQPDSGEISENHKKYWQKNIRLVLSLLVVWFLFSCVLSILAVESLNKIMLGGFPLGFWISQQGTILVFIVLVLVYALRMRQLDREFGVEDEGGDEVGGHE